MNDRLTLHNNLVSIVYPYPVYFQPSENVRLSYPCLVYELANVVTKHADNRNYWHMNKYLATYITKNPDDSIVGQILDGLDCVSFDRHFVSDNLHHFSFNINRTRLNNET